MYETLKSFLKERTDDFKGTLRAFEDKVKGKLPKSEFGRLQDADEHQEKENPYSIDGLKQMDEVIKQRNIAKKKKTSKSHDMEL